MNIAQKEIRASRLQTANNNRKQERIVPCIESYLCFVMRHGFEPSLREWERKARSNIKTLKRIRGEPLFKYIRQRALRMSIRSIGELV